MKKFIYLLLVLLVTTVLVSGCSSNSSETNNTSSAATETKAPETKATEAKAAESTAKAKVEIDLAYQKNGCLDCHVQGKTVKEPDGTEKDISLAGEVKLINGHPSVAPNASFKDCSTCHKSSPEMRNSMVNGLHDVHMNSDIFTGTYKQTCSGCHDMKNIKA